MAAVARAATVRTTAVGAAARGRRVASTLGRSTSNTFLLQVELVSLNDHGRHCWMSEWEDGNTYTTLEVAATTEAVAAGETGEVEATIR